MKKTKLLSFLMAIIFVLTSIAACQQNTPNIPDDSEPGNEDISPETPNDDEPEIPDPAPIDPVVPDEPVVPDDPVVDRNRNISILPRKFFISGKTYL